MKRWSEDGLIIRILCKHSIKLRLSVSLLFDGEKEWVDSCGCPRNTRLRHYSSMTISWDRVIDVGLKSYGLREESYTRLGSCGPDVQI